MHLAVWLMRERANCTQMGKSYDRTPIIRPLIEILYTPRQLNIVNGSDPTFSH